MKKYPAFIMLDENYPDIDGVEVVICDMYGRVSVGLMRDNKSCGVRVFDKTATIGELFEALSEMTKGDQA